MGPEGNWRTCDGNAGCLPGKENRQAQALDISIMIDRRGSPLFPVQSSHQTSEKASELEGQDGIIVGKRSYARLALSSILFFLIVCYQLPFASFCKVLDRFTELPRLTPIHDESAVNIDTAQLLALGQKFGKQFTVDEQLFIDNPSTEILSSSLYDYTKRPHLAGNLALARYTRDKWLAAGIEDVEIIEYEVLLNYPTNRSQVSLYQGSDKVWSAVLKEDVLNEDKGSELAIPFFHGYSKNGSATGQLVYVNYGTPEDFDTVAKLVNLTGKIVIARYGHLFRGIKVELAQQHGAAAVLLYDDPSEDRGVTVGNGFESYPHGPARNPSSVQRGSVQFLPIAPGDPTTPGYPSIPGCKRKDPYTSIPSIPSIPISGRDAAYLLKSMNGNGETLPGFLGAFPGVQYQIIGAKDMTINLDNVVDYDYRPIYNVIAKIPGHFDDDIILGNHRDAWVRGASDPNSGSAALDSIVSTFAALKRTGYQPLRTLTFASWDAEEYGLVGSTEWVEEHAPELAKHAVAYLNVDVASSGTKFHAEASPFLFDMLRNVTKQVPAVNGTSIVPGVPAQQTIYDEWGHYIGTLGSGSDYTAFQDFLGVTSADIGFYDGEAVYHYHSQYDSYHWLTTFGDPGLKALQASARIWGLLAYKLTESPVIAFNATTYGAELKRIVEDTIQSSIQTHDSNLNSQDDQSTEKHNKHHKNHNKSNKGIKSLNAAVRSIASYGTDLDSRAQATNARVSDWQNLNSSEQVELLRQVHALNDEYRQFERAFLDPKGLKGRNFFKHILFAPGRWTGYAPSKGFPSVTEAESEEDRARAIKRVVKILQSVGRK